MASSIGAYSFVDVKGQVRKPQPRIQRLVLAGVNDARYRNLGTGGEPFQLLTRVNVADIAEGHLTMAGYIALKAAGPQTFIHDDYNYTTEESQRVQVLSVEPVQIREIVAWSGSLDDNDTAELVANWTLELKSI